jgi:indole-3-glycerol phosphate synthase
MKQLCAFGSLAVAVMLAAHKATTVAGFVYDVHHRLPTTTRASSLSSSTTLHAIGVLARKAKEAELRKYIQEGIEDAVMEKYKIIQQHQQEQQQSPSTSFGPGPLQQRLTKRRGTITVIAEYKRKVMSASAAIATSTITNVLDPEVCSPVFRDFGASGIAVMADDRMGGCSYGDIGLFVEEQRRAQYKVPGTVPVINSDLIVDEVQLARTAVTGAVAVVLTASVFPNDSQRLCQLIQAARALDLEVIVSVATSDEATMAIQECKARMLLINADGLDAKLDILNTVSDLNPDAVCTIANIVAKPNNQLSEIEEAWTCRDQGFNCVWVSDVLYKASNDASEHPGAILKSITAKSSVKWASPKARAGRGEGAREYLGDILM